MKAKRRLVDRGTMAKVKKRVLALSRWTNQLWRVITCWCISKVTWSHDLNSYKVIWYKSQGLIWVCFKRWDKDVRDPYEAMPWRNHTWDTNDSRSLLHYRIEKSLYWYKKIEFLTRILTRNQKEITYILCLYFLF